MHVNIFQNIETVHLFLVVCGGESDFGTPIDLPRRCAHFINTFVFVLYSWNKISDFCLSGEICPHNWNLELVTRYKSNSIDADNKNGWYKSSSAVGRFVGSR